MNIRPNCTYGVACPTSMGVRLTPEGGLPVHAATSFTMQATSAESNVLSVSSALGYRGLVLTNFVESSPISLFIQSNLRSRNLDFIGPSLPQGGPWGLRHQFNLADSGSGTRGPRVHNDRAGEVGARLDPADFDLAHIFGTLGVGIVHLSGLIAAISDQTAEFCLAVIRAAKANGTRVSFDLNHRASFWKGREAHLRDVFARIAQSADVLVGNEEDYQLCLGIEGPPAGGRDLESKMQSYTNMMTTLQQTFPNAGVFATTLREVVSVNEHRWGSICHMPQDQTHAITPRAIQVLDRIGGGDGYVGGLLYGLLRGWNAEDCNAFGWASGALAATFPTDYAQPADEAMVWSIYEGNARVQR